MFPFFTILYSGIFSVFTRISVLKDFIYYYHYNGESDRFMDLPGGLSLFLELIKLDFFSINLDKFYYLSRLIYKMKCFLFYCYKITNKKKTFLLEMLFTFYHRWRVQPYHSVKFPQWATGDALFIAKLIQNTSATHIT